MALSVLVTSFIACAYFLHAKSLPTVEFKPITPAKHLSASPQEMTTSDILEHAYCKFNTFTDPSAVIQPSFYHWYTQTIATGTSVTIIDDALNEYTTNEALASQLPYLLYYSYTTFDSCVSPITNDIFSCYVVPSCCYGCAFINCNIFENDATTPSWTIFDFFITGNEASGSFTQKPQVLCMNDGYLVSWLYAKRQKPPSMHNCTNPAASDSNLGDGMDFSDYMIQYGTIDLEGNMKLSNQTYTPFSTVDLVTAVDNFQIMAKEGHFYPDIYMTLAHNVSKTGSSYLNVSNGMTAYNGIDKGLQSEYKSYGLYDDESDNGDLNAFENKTATYKSIIVDISEDCCVVTALKTPFYQNANDVMVTWYMDIRYFDGNHINTTFDGKQVGFVDVIELTMLNDDESAGKYFAIIYDDMPHSINVQTFYLHYTADSLIPIQVDFVGEAVQLIGNDANSETDDYIYSFCTNILPNSTNMVMAWAENPNELNALTNVYIQSWQVTETT